MASQNRVRTEALRRASEILGGTTTLRKYLGVSALSLNVWMAGAEPPPTEVFLKAVDVIVERELEELRSKKR
jgi:DNA-binding transcriptional regulator YdaS (Cro superfamily)